MADVLTDTDLESINANIAKLNEAKAQIKLAKQAGLDVSSLETRQNEQMTQLQQIKQTYFPGR